MARAEGTYSRVVAWMKILLPLVALGLLSTIFLFSKKSDPTEDLPVRTRAILEEKESEQASNATYSATMDDGALLTLRAATTRPDPDATDGLVASDFAAQMDMTDGSRINLSSPDAALDNEASTATLRGGVRIISSTGYTIETDTLKAATNRISAESEGTVTATAPEGTLTAGRMVITDQAESGGDDVQLLFTDGVKMIYEPQSD
ncbi:lipopolysaccharide export system protein LptC [Thalassococcus halodurans]|uniref:Lipopolysaccharide export system protein LptC n=1 Tax=Thalassococcus halodurans TaxID=373675 RepID=A0A1H5YTI9_9RHOB|nr:LPS export ABC transporter periplasmic protein LptC [Thalassococcus halodurans]SEG27523.1 lipopolysaccharide export system protein LptC [Thalassococcus halodurans]